MKCIKFLLTPLTLFTYQLHAAQSLIVDVPGDNASSTAGTFAFGSPTLSSGDLRGCFTLWFGEGATINEINMGLNWRF